MVIGAGQLGSRHIQGLLKLSGKQVIHVLDPSADSLKMAQIRSEEIDHHHDIQFYSHQDQVLNYYDLVIVATNADIRYKVLRYYFEKNKCEFLVLEKVLFQNLAEYSIVDDLLTGKGIKTWVNHPRRMYKHYAELAEHIGAGKSEKVLQVNGVNWGLACNGLHYLDLFSFLSNSRLKSVSADNINNVVYPSKRAGFVEFFGQLTGELEDGSRIALNCLEGNSVSVNVTVNTQLFHSTYFEGGNPYRVYYPSDGKTSPLVEKIDPYYQSDLTTKVAQQLFSSTDCKLPTFSEAKHSHELFIEALTNKYNLITGEVSPFCPIT